MTTTIQKTEIKPNWKQEQIQEQTARAFASNMMAAMTVLAKHGEEAVNEFQALTRMPMVKHYKEMGVKTPLDLVKAKAEFETNVFGSKIEIFGDEKEAHLKYLSCAIWNTMKQCGHMNKEQEEKMCAGFANCVSAFAKEFGFEGEVKFENEIATVTFRK